MNDEQEKRMQALLASRQRMNYLLLCVLGVVLMVAGAIALGIKSVAIIAIIGGLALYLLSMLKIQAIDGSGWAKSIGSYIPKWRDPIQRDVDVLEEIQRDTE